MAKDELLPDQAELRAQNLKSLLANNAFDEVIMQLVRELREDAVRDICKVDTTEELFKAAGQLKTCEIFQRSIDSVLAKGEAAKNKRQKKIAEGAQK